MHSSTKHELLLGLQYLLIGLIAQCVVLTWFNAHAAPQKMFVWLAVALAIGFLRLTVLLLVSTYRRNQWTSISRRNWN